MTISTDFLTYFFLFACVIYNFLLCPVFVISEFLSHRRTRRSTHCSLANSGEQLPIMTVMIPALNEERVLEGTLHRLLSLPYPTQLEVLIIDDNSDDGTAAIAEKISATHETAYLLQRGPDRSRRGKGDALNCGFSYLRATFPERDLENWVIGVFDADGRPVEEDFLAETGRVFLDHSVAATQCGVRIRNGHNLLAALQDVEFLAWSFIAQTVRDRTSGAVALGGNGQFIRAAVLDQLSNELGCWDDLSLTEDLDVGTRIHLQGGRIRFIHRWVEQEGIESIKVLFRQRHRWAWGTLQAFLKYVTTGRIMGAKISLAKKLDLQYYLSLWVVPVVVFISFVLSLLNFSGLLYIENNFGVGLLIANSFSFVPLVILGLLWAKVPAYKLTYLIPLTVIYAYHWIPAVILGWVSILAKKKPSWAKTRRFVVEEVREWL